MAPRRYVSKPADPSPLAQPLHFSFSGRTAPNRFLKGAMTERLSSWHPTDLPKRGVPSKELINVYRRWGEGGIGTILTGNVMIAYDHLEAPGNMIITRNEKFFGPRFEAFKELATTAKKHGSLILAQVSHPGRQVDKRIQENPISASDIQVQSSIMGLEFAKPHPATQEEINAIVEGFAHAAEYLEKAGYDGIELHGAHGYLLSQFLSEQTNHRTDAYGGSLSNRARLIIEVAHAIQARVSPSFILGIKINSVEFQAHGFQPEDARELVKILEANRFDFVELSGGTYEQIGFVHKRESSKKRESFFMDFADMIVPALKQTKSFVTGGFRTVGAMVSALNTIDGIGLGRPLTAEPRLVNYILSGKVSGAIDGLFNEMQVFDTSIVASGVHIRQIGKDIEPFDTSDERAVEAFKKDLEKFMKEAAEDVGLNGYGFFDVTGVEAVPYGTAYVEAN